MFLYSPILLKVEEKSQSKDVTIDDQDSVLLGEYIEILSTDDERLSIIGEELSNETGRTILNKLFEGVGSVSEISVSLNISIPLVRWHIQRLAKTNLIKIDHTKLSSKNKSIHQYKPIKFAFVIVPSKVANSEMYSSLLKNSLKKFYQYLPSVIMFVIGTISTYLVMNKDQLLGYSFASKTYPIGMSFDPMAILPFAIGGMSAFVTWLFIKIRHKKK